MVKIEKVITSIIKVSDSLLQMSFTLRLSYSAMSQCPKPHRQIVYVTTGIVTYIICPRVITFLSLTISFLSVRINNTYGTSVTAPVTAPVTALVTAPIASTRGLFCIVQYVKMLFTLNHRLHPVSRGL